MLGFEPLNDLKIFIEIYSIINVLKFNSCQIIIQGNSDTIEYLYAYNAQHEDENETLFYDVDLSMFTSNQTLTFKVKCFYDYITYFNQNSESKSNFFRSYYSFMTYLQSRL